jgi:hypothetical protein
MAEINDVSIREYKKSIVVCGNTKPIKDTLKEMGGKWNSRLNNDGEEFSGWVFSPSKRQEIEDFLASGKVCSSKVCDKKVPSPSAQNCGTNFEQRVLDKLSHIEVLIMDLAFRQTNIEDKLAALDKTMASWVNLQNEESSGEN